MLGIERDRMRHWRIMRVGGRASHELAIRYVLYPAAARRRRADEMQHERVLSMVHRVHRLWFNRVKDLIANNLWLPGGGSKPELTYRRVMNCRPSCVYFKCGNEGKIRPCKHHKFCPFCWGRVAALVYRRFKSRVRKAALEHKNLVLTCRVVEHKIALENYSPGAGMSLEQVIQHGRHLKDIFDHHQAAYKKTAKSLQRKTVGSVYRIVVDPQDDGWAVEIRQLILAPAKSKLPWQRHRKAKTTYLAAAPACDTDKLQDVIGRFLEYPKGLLTNYPELTAAYLQAGYKLRLVTGTGVFRTCSQGLTNAFKQDKKHGEPC